MHPQTKTPQTPSTKQPEPSLVLARTVFGPMRIFFSTLNQACNLRVLASGRFLPYSTSSFFSLLFAGVFWTTAGLLSASAVLFDIITLTIHSTQLKEDNKNTNSKRLHLFAFSALSAQLALSHQLQHLSQSLAPQIQYVKTLLGINLSRLHTAYLRTALLCSNLAESWFLTMHWSCSLFLPDKQLRKLQKALSSAVAQINRVINTLTCQCQLITHSVSRFTGLIGHTLQKLGHTLLQNGNFLAVALPLASLLQAYSTFLYCYGVLSLTTLFALKTLPTHYALIVTLSSNITTLSFVAGLLCFALKIMQWQRNSSSYLSIYQPHAPLKLQTHSSNSYLRKAHNIINICFNSILTSIHLTACFILPVHYRLLAGLGCIADAGMMQLRHSFEGRIARSIIPTTPQYLDQTQAAPHEQDANTPPYTRQTPNTNTTIPTP